MFGKSESRWVLFYLLLLFINLVNVKQIKQWFQNQRRVSKAVQPSQKRNVSVKQVACHVYKQEIAAIADRRANGVKAGNPQYMPSFQAAVTEFMDGLDEDQVLGLEKEQAEWINKSHPVESQRKAAERNGRGFLQKSAEAQYKEMGMRSVVWEFHENKAGVKLFQLLSRQIIFVIHFSDKLIGMTSMKT